MRACWLVSLIGSVVACTPCRAADLKSPEVYSAWLSMYDLNFDDAHQKLKQWRSDHPDDPLGPVSDAAGYLFSELCRLHVLEAELFVNDQQFKNRRTFEADATVKASFEQSLSDADHLADAALKQNGNDARALLAKTLCQGLRADYIALVEGRGVRALSYTRAGRLYSEKLMKADPEAADAYLGPGIENYLLSLKPVAIRFLLRMTGSETDRQKGLQELQKTAEHGYYLEPFAKLLLTVAALRDNDKDRATRILSELHKRFPHNQLYASELDRLAPAAH